MSYKDVLTRLSATTEAQVVAVHASYAAGEIDLETAVALVAGIVAAANGKATALADLALAATIMLALRRPVPTLGLLPAAGTPERLTKAATTLLTIPDVTPERVARLGRAEPLEAATAAYNEGIRESRHVSGWTRDTGGACCELCEWLARDGAVFPDDTDMTTHKGCNCTQQPVIKETA